MNDGAANNNTTASSNTSNRKSSSEETNREDIILDQHQEDDDDDDNDEHMSLNVPGAALIPQHAKPAVYQPLHSWRTNSSTFQSEDGKHTRTSHHTSDDSNTPGRTALPQLHLPDPMKNTVLQGGPTATFRHFVRSCWTTHDDSTGTAAAAAATSSRCPPPPPPSWILPSVTLSTPAPAAVHQHYNSLMMGDNDHSSITPSPIPLDPFQRSTSTPSAFTDCCSTTHTKSSRSSHNNNNSSAFSYALPVQQFLRADTNYQNKLRASPQAVQFYSLARLEHTSIEVQQQQQQPATPSNNNNKRSARKFRSEARVLQRRRNNPPCTTTTTTSCASGNEVVTIFVTGGGGAEATSGTVLPEGLLSGVVTAGTAAAVNEELCCLDMNLVGEGLEDTAVVGHAYYAPGKHNSSPLRPPRSARGRCVSPLTTAATAATATTRASPTMRIRSLSIRRRRSHSHSPPSSSASSRPPVVSLSTAFSTLTTISETDREVMELNHGKTHNQLLRPQHQLHKTESLSDVSGRSSSSQDSNSVLHHARGMTAAPPRHVASPREGATLPADRFFVDHRSTATTATRSSSAMSSAQSSSTNSDTGGSHSSAKEESSPLPRFVSYATDEEEEEDDDHSTRGNGLLEEQREESPSILDGSSSSSAASKTGVLYVPPRSSSRHWRMADTVAAASAAAPELLLFGESVEVTQRTTSSKDLVKLGSAPAEETLL
jgi:hypothetical protein